jgi:hypothetical protein
MFHVKRFGTIRAARNERQLVGLLEYGPLHRVCVFALSPTFAPWSTLAYDGANDSRNGRKETP